MKAVVAMSQNGVIGANGGMPWHLPEDFRWFKELTTGGIVLMGRRTFESLPKPLPNRTNVVFTRRPQQLIEDAAFQAKCQGWPVVELESHDLQSGNGAASFGREIILVCDMDRFVEEMKRGERQDVFVIGGAQIYRRLLPECTDLYLSHVFRVVEGDAFFPPFEDEFECVEVVRKTADFEVRHYRNRALA